MSKTRVVHIEASIDGETAAKLHRMTKKELIERIGSLVVEAEVYKHRCQVAIDDAKNAQGEVGKLNREVKSLQTKLDKSEAYTEQGRAMIEAIMERWYEYDV